MDPKENTQLREAVELIREGRRTETIGILEPLAEKGNPAALFWMGMRCLHAMKVPCNDAKSKRRFRIVRSDKAKAVEYIRQSAEKGFPHALCWMAREHQTGRMLEKDNSKAFLLYQEAAEQEYTPAIYQLSECYCHGRGTARNLNEAFRLCRQVAEAGYPAAEYKLSRYYACGFVDDEYHGDAESAGHDAHEQVLYWCRKSAEHGYMLAQYMTGRYLLEEGDREQAKWWLQKAAKSHLVNARMLLEKIEKEEAGA